MCAALTTLVFFATVHCARGQSTKDAAARAQATALFARALAVSDIRAPGSPPFEMRGTINIKGDKHKPDISGTYLMKWVSPDKWREEIHFANYTRIRVGGKNQYWQSRTTSYEVQPLLQLGQGLDFLKELHVWSNPTDIATLGNARLHQGKVQGTRLDCVTLVRKGQNYGLDDCFDPVMGTLVSDSSGTSEFSDFVSFGGKYFPGNIRTQNPPATPVTLRVISISPLGIANDADFQSPTDATVWPSCDAPDALPVIKSQVNPVYPVNEKLAGIQGAVFVYAVVGVDGLMHNLKVFSAPDSGLADSAVAVLKQWEYVPETCHGTPVPVETVLQIIYTLGSH